MDKKAGASAGFFDRADWQETASVELSAGLTPQ
jgi:hypothetical protein